VEGWLSSVTSALPLSTHSTVEMLHDSALYRFMIDIDINHVPLLKRLSGEMRI